MKKYENKKLSLLATQVDNDNYEVNGSNIPRFMIEGATDWVEKLETYGQTLDGYGIVQGITFYGVTAEFEIKAVDLKFIPENRPIFGLISNAEQWIIDNKPFASLKEVESIIGYKRGEKNKPEVEVLHGKFKKLCDEKTLQNL